MSILLLLVKWTGQWVSGSWQVNAIPVMVSKLQQVTLPVALTQCNEFSYAYNYATSHYVE